MEDSAYVWSASWRTDPIVLLPHMIPYVILIVNCFLFKLLRKLVHQTLIQFRPAEVTRSLQKQSGQAAHKHWSQVTELFAEELVATVELCADCAELNVVYERHGTLAYGLSLFFLTCLWLDTFGHAHTTPGYLIEEIFVGFLSVTGNQLLRQADTYAHFGGQLLGLITAWRFASTYWTLELLDEHKAMLATENCHSALTTSTLNGFLVEFACCLLCRIIELLGQRMLDRNQLGRRTFNIANSLASTVLVVLALELSGGYFNPILAASLEYGCRGAHKYQHAIVFWIGPLLGHVTARLLVGVKEASQGCERQPTPSKTSSRRKSTRRDTNKNRAHFD